MRSGFDDSERIEGVKRYELSDAQWARIAPLLPGKDGDPGRSGVDITSTVQLSSGKFAVVEKSHEFTLVPWRPVIVRQLGREVMGVMRGGSVSWQLGRTRGMEL